MDAIVKLRDFCGSLIPLICLENHKEDMMCPHCKYENPEWITLMEYNFVCSECIKETHSPKEIEPIAKQVLGDFNKIADMFGKA